jgi:hypothetical protein
MARPRESKLPKSARDFIALMEAAGCKSFADAAALTGRSERSIKAYAVDGRPVPVVVTRLLELSRKRKK